MAYLILLFHLNCFASPLLRLDLILTQGGLEVGDIIVAPSRPRSG